MSNRNYTLNIDNINIDASNEPVEKVIADLVKFAYDEMLKMQKNISSVEITSIDKNNLPVKNTVLKESKKRKPVKNIYDFLYEIYGKETKGKYDAGVASATLKKVAKSQDKTSKDFKKEYESGEITVSAKELADKIDISSAVGRFYMEEAARAAEARKAREEREETEKSGMFSEVWGAVKVFFDSKPESNFSDPVKSGKYTKVGIDDKLQVNSGFYRTSGKVHGGWDIHAIENKGVKIYPMLKGRGEVFMAKDTGMGRGGLGIIIEYNINGEKIYMYSGHHQKNMVAEGDQVDENTVIGLVGNTGIDKSKKQGGNHAHVAIYTLKKPSKYLDKLIEENGGDLNIDRASKSETDIRIYYNPYYILDNKKYKPMNNKTYFK